MITGAEAELVGVDHVINALGLSGVFIIFMIPSMVIVFTAAYLWEQHKRKKRAKTDKIQKAIDDNRNKNKSSDEPVITPVNDCIIIEDKYKEKLK